MHVLTERLLVDAQLQGTNIKVNTAIIANDIGEVAEETVNDYLDAPRRIYVT